MKRIIPLILALLLLAACGAEAAEATPTPTPTLEPKEEAPGRVARGSFAVAEGEDVFYILPSGERGMFDPPLPAYLVKNSGDTYETLKSGYISCLSIQGGWLYYIDDGTACRMLSDGSGEDEVLAEAGVYGEISDLAAAEEGVFFLSRSGDASALYRLEPGQEPEKLLDIDGEAHDLAVCGSRVYYSVTNLSNWNSYIFYTGTGEVREFANMRLQSLSPLGGRLCFTNEWTALFNTDAAGQDIRDVSDGVSALAMTADGEWLYYSDGSAIYKLQADGSRLMTLCRFSGGEGMQLAAAGDCLYVSYAGTLSSVDKNSGWVRTVDRLVGPVGSGYVYRDDLLGLEFTIPEELEGEVSIGHGMPYFAPAEPCVSIYHLPSSGDGTHGLLCCIARAPRDAFFDADAWYQVREIAQVLAYSDEYVYFRMPSIGGVDTSSLTLDAYEAAASAFSADYLRGALQVDGPDSVPELDTSAVQEAVSRLRSLGDATLTRAEAAQLAFDLLSAENKEKEYPLEFTDVEPGSESAHAIAYLASYGFFTSVDGRFHPDNALTRAEAVQLLQRLLYIPWPQWYGPGVSVSDADSRHWAWDYLNCAVQNGWLDIENDRLRPDAPITSAELAKALKEACANL